MASIAALRAAPLLLVTSSLCGLAQENVRKADVLYISQTIDFEVTGDGIAKQWKDAEWISLSKRNGSVNYDTQAKLLYSSSGIYVLFACADTTITATYREDYADLYKEDVVEIFFWTDESTPLYFEYELSPLNYELPILVPNFKGNFFGWKPWHYEGDRQTRHAAKVMKDASGSPTSWIAEFFIPFALLKPLQNVPPQSGTRWRMNMYRIDYDQGYASWTWKPVTTNFHDYERFGTIEFK